MKMQVKYVQCVRDARGQWRYYFRRGKARAPLPNPFKDSDRFWTAYYEALKGKPAQDRRRVIPEGSLGDVIDSYIKSRDFLQLKPASQKTYRSAINFLRNRPSVSAPVAAFDGENIDGLLDEMVGEGRAGMARLVYRVFAQLFAVARKRKLITGDPLIDVKPPKGGSYRAWNDAELLRFETRWARGTTERLVYEIALRAGYRRGDIAKLTWNDVKGGRITIIQEKTGQPVKSRIHPSLAQELDATPRRQAVIVTTESGLPFDKHYLGVWFARAIDEAGLPGDCVLHGLRKAFATRLADKGATEHQIMAATGHKTPGMVALYTRQANRDKLADEAGQLMEEDEPETLDCKTGKSITKR